MSNTKFEWTNELIYEFVNFYDEACKKKVTWTSEALEDFKKMKSGNPFTPFITEDGYNVTDGSTTIYAIKKNNIGEYYSWVLNAASCTGDKEAKYFYVKYTRDRWIKENPIDKPGYEILSFKKYGHEEWVFFNLCYDGFFHCDKFENELFTEQDFLNNIFYGVL